MGWVYPQYIKLIDPGTYGFTLFALCNFDIQVGNSFIGSESRRKAEVARSFDRPFCPWVAQWWLSWGCPWCVCFLRGGNTVKPIKRYCWPNNSMFFWVFGWNKYCIIISSHPTTESWWTCIFLATKVNVLGSFFPAKGIQFRCNLIWWVLTWLTAKEKWSQGIAEWQWHLSGASS